MLKRDIRIGDKTPSKISLGKDEPTSICLGDKLIWGGVDDTVDVIVHIDNIEIFDELDDYAELSIGGVNIRVGRNNSTFNFEAKLTNNLLEVKRIGSSSKITNKFEVLFCGTMFYFDDSREFDCSELDKNLPIKLYISFKKVEYINATVYIDNPEIFNETNDTAFIGIGGKSMEIVKDNTGPFNIRPLMENGNVRCSFDSVLLDNMDKAEININGLNYSINKGGDFNSNRFIRGNNEVHIKFKLKPKVEIVDTTVYVDDIDTFFNTISSAKMVIGNHKIRIDRNAIIPFKFKNEMIDNTVECYCSLSEGSLKYNVEMNINGSIEVLEPLTTFYSNSFRKGNNEVHIRLIKNK